MMPRRDRALASLRRNWLPASAVVLLVVGLGWWRPWRGPGPAPTPTPRATVAAIGAPTRAPQQIALPTSAPPAAPTLRPPVAATPATPVVAASGELLYLGPLDNSGGIIALDPAGEKRRLLIPGVFDWFYPSPDGARIAATGPIPGSPNDHQLTIFASDGRALARYPIGRGVTAGVSWSPSGKYLLCTINSGGGPVVQEWATWVFGEDGAWQIGSPAGNPVSRNWTPDDRIAFVGRADPLQPRSAILWTIDATGNDLRKLYEGPHYPIGWSGNGALFYALAFPNDTEGPATGLVAVETASGAVRRIATADELATPSVLRLSVEPGTYHFTFAVPAPDGNSFALGLFRDEPNGTPPPRSASRGGFIVFLRLTGQITGVATLPIRGQLGPGAWSVDGSRFAIFVAGERTGDAELFAFATSGAQLVRSTAERAYLGLLPQLAWSPDGRWLVHTGTDGLMVAAFHPLDGSFLRGYPLAPGATAPAWLPTRRP